MSDLTHEMAPVTTRGFSPSSISRGLSTQNQSSGTSPVDGEAEPDQRSYRAYLQRVRGSKPYWFLIDHMVQGPDGDYRSPSAQPPNAIFILEVASDGSQKDFNYETRERLEEHLKTPYIHDGYGLMNTSSRGRRVVLVTDLSTAILEVLGGVYGMDFGFFADHLLPDEHVSYTAKTTRGYHCHIVEDQNPPSKRVQFEYRELSRLVKSKQSSRNVCRVFGGASSHLNWDAIFQRRFSLFSHNPSDGGLRTDIYLFDEHAFRGPFALGVSRLDLPSFLDFKDGNSERFERSLGVYPQHTRNDVHNRSSPFQDELVNFFQSRDFDPRRAFESSSYIVNHILKLTLVMWRHLLLKMEYSFLDAVENEAASVDIHDGSLSLVSAELSKCSRLVQKKTIPAIKALCESYVGEDILEGILEEYITLGEDLQHVATRAEKAHTIRLSKLSILESQKAIEHSVRGIELAKRVGRLTKLAFVFIPLSFVTSFLGMMQFDGNFTEQTSRVIWIFLAMSLPLVLITVLLTVPDHILSVANRFVYLTKRRLGIGWVFDEAAMKYYIQRGDAWEEYHKWLRLVGWERIEDINPQKLIVAGDDDDDKGGQHRVGLMLGTWLHLKHAWREVK